MSAKERLEAYLWQPLLPRSAHQSGPLKSEPDLLRMETR